MLKEPGPRQNCVSSKVFQVNVRLQMGPWKKCTVRLDFANKNMLHSGSPKSICVYIVESIAIPIGVECRCIIELAKPDSSM